MVMGGVPEFVSSGLCRSPSGGRLRAFILSPKLQKASFEVRKVIIPMFQADLNKGSCQDTCCSIRSWLDADPLKTLTSNCRYLGRSEQGDRTLGVSLLCPYF